MSKELLLPAGTLRFDRVLVMGILNTTPDSFYDGGRYNERERALARAQEMVEEGADIIDVGGEKAGPGAPVSVEEEKRRVLPVIEDLRAKLDVTLSIDTFKPDVARAAVDAGASIINGIGGFEQQEMRTVGAETKAAIVIMHIKGQPRVANPNPVYADPVGEVRDWLQQRAEQCIGAGIAAERILIDPGPGFGKRTEHDVAIVRHLDVFSAMPFPVLLAASRKKFIGDILGSDAEHRLEGSLAVAVWGVLKGASIIRAHDVRATVRVVRMTEAVLNPAAVKDKG